MPRTSDVTPSLGPRVRLRDSSCRWLAWLLLGVAAFALGCAATHPHVQTHATTRAGADPDTLPTPAMYATLCAQCHGAGATGYAADHAPSLVNPTFLESAGDLYLRRSIEQGRPGTSMGAYAKVNGGPLGPSAITRLAGWLQSHGPAVRSLP